MKKITLIMIVAVFAGVVFFVHHRAYNATSHNISDQIFMVSEGDDIVTIGKKLESENLIESRFYFYYYAWQNKLRGKLIADTYLISPTSTIADIVYKFTTSGESLIKKRQDIKVTFPEGWTSKKIAQRLSANNLPGDDFLQIVEEPHAELYEKYDFLVTEKGLEGFLFPDTYFFMPNATAEVIVDKMLANFAAKVDEDRRNMITTQGWALYDLLIFASIIEGEVPSNVDRALVAGVFKNRLDIGMALQSDATIDYIKGFPEIKHTLADIAIESPYNTYKYPGLPPGPINNPSLASIDAAIAPAQTDYMYFLNNVETGETVFSRSLDEHNRNKSLHGL
jgi:UPF0755 protein